MEQTVYLFCCGKQFRRWKIENCENCRKEATLYPGCDLSSALTEALFLEGAVPLKIAERIGYFDFDDDHGLVPPATWTCREFQERDLSRALPAGDGRRRRRQLPRPAGPVAPG